MLTFLSCEELGCAVSVFVHKVYSSVDRVLECFSFACAWQAASLLPDHGLDLCFLHGEGVQSPSHYPSEIGMLEGLCVFCFKWNGPRDALTQKKAGFSCSGLNAYLQRAEFMALIKRNNFLTECHTRPNKRVPPNFYIYHI